jgi:hypothetical protein
MGYNDNTTDFFIDATLTDHGRQLLARNDGSFSIVRFRLGDDEIDYRNWNELTGSDNKDQKILDTPIMEAFTNEIIALRNPLITIKNASLQYLPDMVANPSAAALKDRIDSTGGGVSITTSQQTTQSQAVIPAELVDFNYLILVDNDLIYVADEVPVAIAPYGAARYIIAADSGQTTAANGSQCTFTLRVQTLNSSIFDILAGATAAKPRTINTTVQVVGQQSGLGADIPVSILEFVNS